MLGSLVFSRRSKAARERVRCSVDYRVRWPAAHPTLAAASWLVAGCPHESPQPRRDPFVNDRGVPVELVVVEHAEDVGGPEQRADPLGAA